MAQTNPFTLSGKTALITGSAQGIGLATAQAFHRAGATVILTDIQEGTGENAAGTLGGRAKYMHLDVTLEASWKKVCQDISGFDVLVNNAGTTGLSNTLGPHDPEHLDMNSWKEVHRVNLDGVALGCKYAISAMKERGGGSIINISSRSGVVGIPAATAYAASKAGVRNHTKSVALYCAENSYNIRCNSIHPGAILTPMWDPMLGEGAARIEAIAGVAAGVPLGRMGLADDVAYAALYLASDASSYITGTEIHVDGGILAGSSATPEPK